MNGQAPTAGHDDLPPNSAQRSAARPVDAARLAGVDPADEVHEVDRTDPVDEVDVDEVDEVDRIVTAWRRELPGLDVAPLHVLSRISRLSRHLDLARRGAFAANDLEPWEFDVLSALRRVGEPYEMSPSVLVHETLSTSGTMTNRIVRLEGRGFVTRHRDPHDGRGTRVRLTEAGRTAAEATLTTLVDREHELLGGLTESDQAALTALLRRLLLSFP